MNFVYEVLEEWKRYHKRMVRELEEAQAKLISQTDSHKQLERLLA